MNRCISIFVQVDSSVACSETFGRSPCDHVVYVSHKFVYIETQNHRGFFYLQSFCEIEISCDHPLEK